MAVSTSLTTIDHAGSVIKTATNTCDEPTIYTLNDYLTDAQLHINGPSQDISADDTRHIRPLWQGLSH